MAVELQRVPGAPMAQTVHIRAHDLVADGSVEEGGTDSGPSPHDLYDAALGACKKGRRKEGKKRKEKVKHTK